MAFEITRFDVLRDESHFCERCHDGQTKAVFEVHIFNAGQLYLCLMHTEEIMEASISE